jgi:hypothetical protein
MTAGQKLAEKYADALARASRDAGRELEWTEGEQTALRLAVESADGSERIKALLDEELARPEPRSTVVTRYSAEWRLLNKAQMDYEWRLTPGLSPAKDPAKVRAGHARWNRQSSVGA